MKNESQSIKISKKEFIKILENQKDFLESFMIKNACGFTRPDSKNMSKIGLISTCFAMTSLSKAKIVLHMNLKQNFINYAENEVWNINRDGENNSSQPENEPDVYTIPIVLNSFKYVEKKSKKLNSSLELLANTVIKNDGAVRFSDAYPQSGYLTFSAVNAFFDSNFESISFDSNKNKNEKQKENIRTAIEKAYNWMESELYKQLGYYKSSNHDKTDPIRCIFSLAGYKRIHDEGKQTKNNLKFINKKKLDKKLYNEVIKCIFADQQENGLWQKYKPTLAIPDQGNVYPFAIYSLDRLVDLSDETVDIFDNYSKNIRMALDWINSNILEVPNNNDPEIIYRGWRSPHSAIEGAPECWSTALVFDAVRCMRKKVSSDLNKEIIENLYKGKFFNTEKFKGKKDLIPFNITEKKLDDFDNYYWEDEKLGEKLNKAILKLCKDISEFEEKFDFDKESYKKEKRSTKTPPNAIFLYGPPGTGKTLLTKFVANELGWSYLRIDTGMLLNQGLDKAAASINKVFEDISNLERTVILFDEIDETIKKRTLIEGGIENRVLTNVMLTKLNDLKDNKKILYFVNSNYYEQIDKAIKRKGRFDKYYHLGLNKKSGFDANIKDSIKEIVGFEFESNNSRLMNQNEFDKLLECIKKIKLEDKIEKILNVNEVNEYSSDLLKKIKEYLVDSKNKEKHQNPKLPTEIENIIAEKREFNQEEKENLKKIFEKIFFEEIYDSQDENVVYLSEENWQELIRTILIIIPKIMKDLPKPDVDSTCELTSFDYFLSIWKPLSDKVEKIKSIEKKDDELVD